MRIAASLLVASTLAIAACADNEPVANDVNLTMNDTALSDTNLVGNDAAPLAPAANFVGGDGAALGSVTVEDSAGGVVLRLAGSGMPAGTHGLHIHMVGKCEGPKFESAGAHWNPDNKQHGLENPEGPHRGDLPNATVGADGSLTESLTIAGVSLAELRDSDGSALVVHAQPDDNMTDPSGNSGDRIACAVIAPAG
ncbi:superoxide dismutase family protein [Sphingomonas sp. HDW15A]|uniref:superoxide dismutase family protein n=1 Tax=Sphingomonas sp. HDW15A TaxID=2714942 RepID=UPI00140DD9BC|nr:superoxide dismutase family protein [Sphingomonas sp. HDW15A]QIK96352.1 superoxide dismutase family protein [Sphingomonas sp. HDW15A]